MPPEVRARKAKNQTTKGIPGFPLRGRARVTVFDARQRRKPKKGRL
jgi:hypothetical protein